MQTIKTTTIRFPELRLHASAGHQLRGYFGNLFKERSPLLHNHLADGSAIYQYPLVQYKVLKGTPTLLGLGEGAELLAELFSHIKDLHLGEAHYPVYSKNIVTNRAPLGVNPTELYEYRFDTLWMCLNDKNYAKYHQTRPKEREALLQKILIGNLLSMCKGLGHTATAQILAKPKVKEEATHFKNQKMKAFSGAFTCNVVLPQGIGIGKAVSRGYGAVVI
ncbi:CRISPR-associated endonuclease Cas6 [uncultured Microscilla sp.]|uniref:CRISPR-associated endonuclease Cas6 n=1 Tax=uncultured Microscilla sp. TaxID=432653 RepID=UPI002602A8F3|nr:CRISPR-associated endonuclease Cas6 [uncultured Microscilla sp.]